MHQEYLPPAIAKLVNGKWLRRAADEGIKYLALDSRKVTEPTATLFFAIIGKRHNGHSYLLEAYQKGIRNFIVSEEQDYMQLPEANIILVKNSVQALQTLAANHRNQFNIPVVGITGSNGKTIVKEWLYQLLNEDYKIVRSPRSYNSQVGVPLSVWQMTEEDTLALFEAGISEAGEMELLEKVIKPEIGIFTNIGAAHAEGFLNDRHKIKEKLKLFVNSKVLIYCRDHHEITQAITEYRQLFKSEEDQLTRFKVFTWSQQGQDADLKITAIEKGLNIARITGQFNGASNTIEVPFIDDASIENVLHCWTLLLYLKLPQDMIAARISKLGKIAMRLELKNAINGSSLINDSYNSDIGSLGIALDFLNQQKQHSRKTIILSDILQSGKSATDLYAQVAQMVGKQGVERVIGIGKDISAQRSQFENGATETWFFDDTDSFLQHLPELSFRNETILLKGARSFEFERISKLLEQKVHETVLEINLDAVASNLQAYNGLLKPGIKMMVMVKAFSYGSGSHEIASTLQFHRADYLAVAYTDEGIALRQAGVTLPIMVMNPEQYSFEGLVQYKLEPELYSIGMAQKFLLALQELKLDEPYPVHIEVDTGMKRLGFDEADLKALVMLLNNTKLLKVISVFSHLSGSEASVHDDFTKDQIDRFKKMYATISDGIGEKPMRHILNSAGIVRHREAHMDMVRLGLGLYGIDTTGKLQDKLKAVGRLKTTISQIKEISRGDTIGYNRAGRADLVQRIATVGIGYADGVDRRFSNGTGKMMIHGKLAPIAGNVCMDMCMLDITAIPEAREGDEVIVFGPELPVDKVAGWIDTIPYEILTKVSERVKRVFYHE